MQIGFDLDKIFIDTPPFIPTSIIQKLYRKKSDGELLYRIPSVPEQIFRRLTHYPQLRPPINENIQLLLTFPKNHNKLYLISSRYKFLQGVTNQLVKKHKLDSVFDAMYFNYNNEQPHEFKNKLLKKLQLNVYIDDDLSLLQYVAKDNPKTKFYWLKTGAYDHYRKMHPVLQKNVFPVDNLKTAINKL
jgi:hypothetical protein